MNLIINSKWVKVKMCVVVESYGCYNVSEGTYGYVRYICCNEGLYFWIYDSNHVVFEYDWPYVSMNFKMKWSKVKYFNVLTMKLKECKRF